MIDTLTLHMESSHQKPTDSIDDSLNMLQRQILVAPRVVHREDFFGTANVTENTQARDPQSLAERIRAHPQVVSCCLFFSCFLVGAKTRHTAGFMTAHATATELIFH